MQKKAAAWSGEIPCEKTDIPHPLVSAVNLVYLLTSSLDCAPVIYPSADNELWAYYPNSCFVCEEFLESYGRFMAAAGITVYGGADEVVYPEEQLASWTAIRYTSDKVFDYIALDGDYAIYELSVPKSWAGKTVGEINIRRKYAINILAVRKDGRLCPDISTETLLEDSDILLVLGSNASVRKCFHI